MGTRTSAAVRFRLGRLILAPILSVALMVVALPSGAAAPNGQGETASGGRVRAALPVPAYEAPQYGRPSGAGVGRRN